MPYALSNGVRIYYEVVGEGPPLVLVEGLGYARWMWTLQVPDLSKDHKLIIFDNRGVGKSDKPQKPYIMSEYASDLEAVLDAAGVERAHILGVSMGGMIAQYFALKREKRVRSLILVSTHHGGPEVEPTPPETVQAMFGPPPPHVKSERELYIYKMSFALSKEWVERNREVLEMLVDLRLREPQPLEAYMNQAHAVIGFDVSGEISKISRPTLIIHGDADRVVPVGNAFKLHEKIRSSRLVVFRGAGHLVNVERAEDFNKIVRRFIREVEEGVFKPGGVEYV